ncbi:hypothetical protein D9611_001800 [Ephemerocybe angulata]|uniref:F-box domain-containing protein n=1 Tax=Ephemerocybe angulata TaxID=980116 RepID=A0A8H5FM60_9AGAR|nr:hypothetical protein D9611_001800 [Tulosesus angulatus]
MAAHYIAAYSPPMKLGVYDGSAQTNSILSRFWSNDLPSHGLFFPDDIEAAVHMLLHGDERSSQERDELSTKATSAEADSCQSMSEEVLSRMKEMPLEIVFEILLHLHPSDLLSIARSSQRLREIVLSKRSRFIWTECLSNVRGLPSCPLDMTEPQFAKLVFDQTCQVSVLFLFAFASIANFIALLDTNLSSASASFGFITVIEIALVADSISDDIMSFCGKQGMRDVFWACQVRCCPTCVQKQFISEEELRARIPKDVGIEKLSTIFPYTVVNLYQPKQPSKVLYYHPIATRYLGELEDVLASNAGSIHSTEGLEDWVKLKEENQIERIKHASLCEHWYNHWAVRTAPRSSDIPLFDLAVTAVLSSALIYLWKDRIFG